MALMPLNVGAILFTATAGIVLPKEKPSFGTDEWHSPQTEIIVCGHCVRMHQSDMCARTSDVLDPTNIYIYIY